MSQRYIGGVVTETTNVAQSPWTGEWTQQAALQGFAGAQAPLKVANSLRFRSSASAYLSRTPSVAGNRQTWTWSGWVKRGQLGANSYPFVCSYAASDAGFLGIYFPSDDTLAVSGYNTYWRKTTQVFRDPSSWYHIVVAFDTTQTTGANRVKVYVNGVQVTAFGTSNDPTLNTDYPVNNNQSHFHGCYSLGTPTNFFDGYLADINFIDGQALPPTAFGTINKENGVWSPITYTGTYGTNGFKLNFSNGTSTTTLGYDSSGNGNNWTTNNISSTYDWMIDSPTKYPGSSYGVGNYCVLMPFTVCNAVSAGWGTSSASDGNLNYSSISSVSNSWSSFALPLSGKYYAEMRFSSLTTGSTGVLAYDGNANRSVIFYQNGTVYNNNVLSQSLTAWSSGDTIGLAINMDASTIQFYRNGSAVGTAESITVAYGKYFIFNRYQAYLEANFGQRPFAYTPPSGYKSLCTQNLPVATIYNGAMYMNAALSVSGGSGGRTISSLNFQPDFLWDKPRSSVDDHILADTNRGLSLDLTSNNTAAEVTRTTFFTSVNNTGFVVGSGDFSAGKSMVTWCWKAGGTAVTNTAGSITSSVSANTTSGFSVVTYSGTGSTATVGHGLGVAPSMVIVKTRNTSNANDWSTYHVSLGNGSRIFLCTTQASGPSGAWNSTSPTASVFTVAGGYNELNYAGNTYVAYCFAAIPGYSAFGSYTGNGSADGPFVYCGFRPRWILIKSSTYAVGTPWRILDTSRDTYNVAATYLEPNSSNAEVTNTATSPIDILSNGFKPRVNSTIYNNSGDTYIYAAFAENPFQNALAR